MLKELGLEGKIKRVVNVFGNLIIRGDKKYQEEKEQRF